MNKPKILVFDIETAPNLGYVWGKWEQNVLEYDKEWYIMCFCAKWLGEKKTIVKSLPDYKMYKANPEDDNFLVRDLWKLIDEADIVIAHNGDQFDIKKMNTRFVAHQMDAPSPYISIDTLKVARRYFKFNSNKLDDLGEFLTVGRKVESGGWKLWSECLKGSMKAWKLMVKYCKQDVLLLEKVYYELRPWMTNHPNINVLTGDTDGCPACGSHNLQKRGFRITKTTKRQAYACQDCGIWSSGRTNLLEDRIDIR